jgi:RNA polymerase sigma factor (sigma-70 family)
MRANASSLRIRLRKPNAVWKMSPVMDPESSFELLERARSGDTEALDRLLARYLPVLQRWASGRLPRWARDISDTHDLVQDTIVSALRHVCDFKPQHDGALHAYLRRAVMNRIRDELRHRSRRPAPEQIPESAATTMASPLEEAIGLEALNRYEAALAMLNEEDQAAVVMKVELGASYEQTATALGKPSIDAARMAVQRALARLATRMAHAD